MPRSRSRSRSPRRDKPRTDRGLRWKDTPRAAKDSTSKKDSTNPRESKRDKSPKEKKRDKPSQPDREPATAQRHDRDVPPESIADAIPPSIDDDIAAKFGASAAVKFKATAKPPPAAAPVVSTPAAAVSQIATPSARANEPMILVTINDRLGTKAQIPCLASDPVRLFKAQVAARIGRQPHEIMLKRQGERPFKDALTLEDYGVSNGVQLDLELDTGD